MARNHLQEWGCSKSMDWQFEGEALVQGECQDCSACWWAESGMGWNSLGYDKPPQFRNIE